MTPQEHAKYVRCHSATVDRLRHQLHMAREQLAEAKAVRNQAIIDDPRRSHTQVGNDFGVSAIWVKKIRVRGRKSTSDTDQNQLPQSPHE